MKNKLLSFLLCVALLTLSLPLLAGCNGNEGEAAEVPSCYLDSGSTVLTLDGVDFSIEGHREKQDLNTTLTITLLLFNQKNEGVFLNITNARVVREKGTIAYSHIWPVIQHIPAGLKRRVEISFEIPTPIAEERYYLQFDVLGKSLRFYLYGENAAPGSEE